MLGRPWWSAASFIDRIPADTPFYSGKDKRQKFLVAIDKAVPAGLDVHLVCDNYATHHIAEIKTWLGKHPRFYVRCTRIGSSWMNQVERCFGLLTDKLIRRGVHTSVKAPEDDIAAWIENPRSFTWTKTADEILNALTKVGADNQKTGENSPSEFLGGVGNLRIGADNNPRYSARRLVELLIAELRLPRWPQRVSRAPSTTTSLTCA
ncbi:hypothetical protein AB0D04_05520 [Streptomyces sp. NPDC048483]|uniref:hypothetical protein n=1 Tax=Streptomyces sp. NPDC048483 TaxID=3154927 RepID=UPI003414C82E